MTKNSVLLVEDETFLCWVLDEALRDGGYEVEAQNTGNDGWVALESGQSFDALVTDIRLEDGPDGWALASRAREINPSIAVLYVSGDSAAEHQTNGVERSSMIAKPFELDHLLTVLRSLLDS